jgi:hypothetical protein
MGIDAITSGSLTYSASGTERFRKMAEEASPAAQLEKYVKMTPAERMRDAILKKVGVTEEELAAMGPDERKSIEDKIAALTKQEMEKTQETPQKGSFIDVAV